MLARWTSTIYVRKPTCGVSSAHSVCSSRRIDVHQRRNIFTISLSAQAVREYSRQVRLASASQEQRQIGGLLLGTAALESAAVHIQNLEPVECAPGDQRSKPSADVLRAQIREAIAHPKNTTGRGVSVLGFYRTQANSSLEPESADQYLLEACFPTSEGICALINP